MAAHASPAASRSGTVKRFSSRGSVSLGQVLPGQRRRDRSAQHRPQRVRRGDRPVAAVLVEVHEDPLSPLLLPPRGGDLVVTPLELAAEADRRVPDVDELPRRPDPDVDVHAPVAAGLHEAGDAELREQLARHARHPDRVAERRPGLRVEVDAQLVGPVHVGTAYRPGVDVQAERLVHGNTSAVIDTGRGLFLDIDNPFQATRYHSLIVAREGLPESLQVMAWTPENEIMAIRHKEHETWGVQFHPESILTTVGKDILKNFLLLLPAPSPAGGR